MISILSDTVFDIKYSKQKQSNINYPEKLIVSKKTTAQPTIIKNALYKKVVNKKMTGNKIATRKQVVTAIEPTLRHEMITTMAYFRAKERNFESGNEVADWLESERQIDSMLIHK